MDENDKLYEELEQLTKKQKSISDPKSQKRREELDFNEEERLELSKRLDLLSEENEILVQQQRTHMSEIEKLRTELVSKSKEG